jgi:hypothetical protein
VELSRRRYGGGGQLSEHPCDRLVDAAESAVSVAVRQMCVREGTNARSFDRGRENLRHLAGVEVGEEQFRQLVEAEGKAVLRQSDEEQLELDWSASQCRATTPQGKQVTRMYVGADGVLVPTTTRAEKGKRRETVLGRRRQMPRQRRRGLKPLRPVKRGSDQRYKQVYVTSFYDQGQHHRLVGVTGGKVKGLRRLLRRDARRVLLRGAVERIGMVDGAVCLRNHLEPLPLEEILLDFYHLSEHVGEAAAKTLGSGTPEAEKWLGETLHVLRHEGYDPFLRRLLDWRAPLRGHKRAAADKLLGYVTARRDMILYEKCDPRGWDVGSGPTESMCGVTTDRVKGRGRRWDLDNAEAMMALEALYQSTGLWDRYWAKAFANRT